LREALAGPGSAVLVAPPGAGKTTLIPLALLDEPWLRGRRILMLEPRRLAARAAAERMAELLGEADAGGTVGYRMRLETRVGPTTRIEVVTEGVLTRMIQTDPALDGVGIVVFDELHERSLQADLGLALVLHARGLLRPELRVLAMSATLAAEPVAELLEGAPVIRSEGRIFPVETRWLERPVEGWIEPHVVRTVLDALDRDGGDVLVFLPGAAEIHRTRERLEEAGLPAAVDVHALFGMLPRDEQRRALAPAPPGRRKVVLASAIAETSLTIEGVRVVVDAGLMRVPRFDPGSGMTRLETVRVTRDAADQRRGRAGRTAPGACSRMWTRDEDRGLVPERAPEMREADLAPLVLELARWGAEPDDLRWIDPPPAAAVAQARELLAELEALDGSGRLTPHGRRMTELGLHPRLAHMVLRGADLGHGRLACDLAALLDDRDVLRGGDGATPSDLRLRMELIAGGRSDGRADRGALARVRKQAQTLRRRVDVAADVAADAAASDESGGEVGHVGLLTALAYPDRVARLRSGGRTRFLLRNGKGVALDPTDPLAGEPWIAVADLDPRGREGRVFRAAPLSAEEVEDAFGSQVTEDDEVSWDDAAGRVVARRVRRLGALVLRQGALRSPDADAVARALSAGVRAAGLQALPWTKETQQLRARLDFLHHLEPSSWPDASEPSLLDTLEAWLAPFLGGMRSLADVAKADLAEALLARVGWERRADVDRLAPSHMEVPSGSRIALDYGDPEAPALAVRLQEVFGMTETPRVGGGRVPLTLRLLSPAHRPVQVTSDLASFWRDAYFDVRKDLRARYPKHAWPEDPIAAEPTRRTKRRSE
jgi:ATP-dependent helicase HrpB